MLNKKKNNKGFTLVELLVVIAIIGVLAVVAVPALFKNIEKGKIASLESDISAIRSASLSYYADKSIYPNNSNTTTQGIIDALDGELEGLSDPFGSTYTLSGTVPNDLTLTITFGNGKSISKKGIDKLNKELSGIAEGTAVENKVTVKLITGNNTNDDAGDGSKS